MAPPARLLAQRPDLSLSEGVPGAPMPLGQRCSGKARQWYCCSGSAAAELAAKSRWVGACATVLAGTLATAQVNCMESTYVVTVCVFCHCSAGTGHHGCCVACPAHAGALPVLSGTCFSSFGIVITDRHWAPGSEQRVGPHQHNTTARCWEPVTRLAVPWANQRRATKSLAATPVPTPGAKRC